LERAVVAIQTFLKLAASALVMTHAWVLERAEPSPEILQTAHATVLMHVFVLEI
jgi:hypothetical protein